MRDPRRESRRPIAREIVPAPPSNRLTGFHSASRNSADAFLDPRQQIGRGQRLVTIALTAGEPRPQDRVRGRRRGVQGVRPECSPWSDRSAPARRRALSGPAAMLERRAFARGAAEGADRRRKDRLLRQLVVVFVAVELFDGSFESPAGRAARPRRSRPRRPAPIARRLAQWDRRSTAWRSSSADCSWRRDACCTRPIQFLSGGVRSRTQPLERSASPSTGRSQRYFRVFAGTWRASSPLSFGSRWRSATMRRKRRRRIAVLPL